MVKKSEPVSAENLSKYIVKGIQEKKGVDIVILNLMGISNAIADFFVICTGTSDTQVDAIADSIEKEVISGAKEKPWHREGFQNKEWILLDYVNVVVHIFKKDIRSFYGLEDLWGDAKVTKIENP
ncbi:MAG TPA: ribosome silencing factor [Draconibacterium sp.]|nr:ribosome silencing factor [Draconibacterium sp.]